MDCEQNDMLGAKELEGSFYSEKGKVLECTLLCYFYSWSS